MIRHHRLVELYLAQALGVPWDQVHQEAEKWEHVVSRDIASKMDEALGFPTTDPHGQPIPNSNGTISQAQTIRLDQLEPEQNAVIIEVNDHSPDLLRYLADLGLIPQTRISILTREPFNGPITLRVNRKKCSIGTEVASHIFVTRLESRK